MCSWPDQQRESGTQLPNSNAAVAIATGARRRKERRRAKRVAAREAGKGGGHWSWPLRPPAMRLRLRLDMGLVLIAAMNTHSFALPHLATTNTVFHRSDSDEDQPSQASSTHAHGRIHARHAERDPASVIPHPCVVVQGEDQLRGRCSTHQLFFEIMYYVKTSTCL